MMIKKASTLLILSFLCSGCSFFVTNSGWGTSSVNTSKPSDDYYVSSIADLASTSSYSGTIYLSNDLDLTGYEGQIALKSGAKFDGNNHKIANYVSTTPMFSFGNNAVRVSNLVIESSTINRDGDIENFGMISGEMASGTIDNVIVSGKVTASFCENVGGLVGYLHDGKLNNSKSNVIVEGKNQVGGFVGYGVLTRSSFLSLTNFGNVTGKNQVAGIIGSLYSNSGSNDDVFTFSSCTNNGTIHGTNNVGGISGLLRSKRYDYGDKYGRRSFINCQNNGDIVADGACAGGISADSELVNDVSGCKNYGSVSGMSYVAGIIGLRSVISFYADDFFNAINCENHGDITCLGSAGHTGGLFNRGGRMSKCYNYGNVLSSLNAPYTAGLATDLAVGDSGTSSSTVGGINDNGVLDCTNFGTVTGGNYTAGAFSTTHGREITYTLLRIVNEGKVIGKDYTGGIIGCPSSGSYYMRVQLLHSTNKGDITGNDYVGGIVGFRNGHFDSDDTVLASLDNQGLVTAEGTHVGDIYGA